MLRRRLCSSATFVWLNGKVLSNQYDMLLLSLLDELVKDPG